MTTPYNVIDGRYQFPSDAYTIEVKDPKPGRNGGIYGLVTFYTIEANAVLGTDSGDLNSQRFRDALSASVAARNSGDSFRVQNDLISVALALRSDLDMGSRNAVPKFQSASDFIKGVPAPGKEVVSGLFSKGGFYCFSAKAKTGKSLLLLNLGLAVANGCQFLGRATDKGLVLSMLLEDSPATIKARLNVMAGRNKLPDNFQVSTDRFQLNDENYSAIVSRCTGASLVICDPIIQATGVSDWNSAAEVREAFDRYRRLARDAGVCVIASYHHRKMAGEYGDAMSGSMQAFATIDGSVEIYRDPNLEKVERKMTFVGRDWPDLQDEVIALDDRSLTFKAVGTISERKEIQKENKEQEKLQQLLEVLPQEEPGMTIDEVVEATEQGKYTVRELLKAHKRSITRTGLGKSGQPFRYHR
jgi:hypothetical protein